MAAGEPADLLGVFDLVTHQPGIELSSQLDGLKLFRNPTLEFKSDYVVPFKKPYSE